MRSLDFRRDIVPFLVATLGEFFALVLWLRYQDAGDIATARVALWIGFAVERIAVAMWVRQSFGPALGVASGPIWKTGIFLFIITLVEVTIWDVWLRTARSTGDMAGPMTAALLLFVLIHALHSLEMGAVRNQNPLIFAVKGRTLFFSLMETVAGAGWLALAARGHPTLGALVLLVGLTVEHIIQGGLLKPATADSPTVAAPA
ncbi:MAG: hypothetical protein M3Z10_02015 [Gemmatimonadota bacterium]|nr:hypothetical protein [Gemmatimonadota bacterium]